MPERRRHERVNKRIQVEYGEDDLETRGLVTDISVGGLFIKCRRPMELDTRIHIHVLDPENDFYAEGIVVRQRKIDPRYRMIEDQGMGIRFLQPAELVRAVVPKTARRAETNAVVCSSPAEVEKILSEQLSSGLLLVPVSSPVPSASTVVEFTIRMEFGSFPTLEGQGRVLQVFETGEPRVVVEVQDGAALREALEAALK